MPNHVAGHRRSYLKLSFRNTQEMQDVKRELLPVVQKNRAAAEAAGAALGSSTSGGGGDASPEDLFEVLVDMREYDVQYTMRVSIDLEIFVGAWCVRSEASENTEKEKQSPLFFPPHPAPPFLFCFVQVHGHPHRARRAGGA